MLRCAATRGALAGNMKRCDRNCQDGKQRNNHVGVGAPGQQVPLAHHARPHQALKTRVSVVGELPVKQRTARRVCLRGLPCF